MLNCNFEKECESYLNHIDNKDKNPTHKVPSKSKVEKLCK